MEIKDPSEEYRAAVKRLQELADDVSARRSQQEVAQTLFNLRVAVARAYQASDARFSGKGGARQRILDHLSQHVGAWVEGEDLAVVSGIGEWARRIRELRVEQGFEIEEESRRYRLTSLEPNLDRRERWRTVTNIKKEDVPAENRVLSVLETFVGRVVALEEVNRVAGGKDGARLARELRLRELLPVECSADAPDLTAGDHRLVSVRDADRLHPSQVLFGEDLRRQVFRRDRFTCWTCRRDRSAARKEDGMPFYLVVRHLDAMPDDLPELPVEKLTDLTRLATSCNRCAAPVGRSGYSGRGSGNHRSMGAVPR